MWDTSMAEPISAWGKTPWKAPGSPEVLVNIHVHMYKQNTEMSSHHQSLPATILHWLHITVATDVKQELTATGWQGARYSEIYGFIWRFGQKNEN